MSSLLAPTARPSFLALRPARASNISRARVVACRASRVDVENDDASRSRSIMGRRASLASIALASSIALPAPLAPIARAASDPAALTDYVTDTKDMIARQRSLLRVGDGDLDAYVAKADAYFAGYKARLYTGYHTTASAW